VNNFVSILIAVLENTGVLSADEAAKLVKEIHSGTLPDNYEAASRMVKDIVSKHKISTVHEKVANKLNVIKNIDTKKK